MKYFVCRIKILVFFVSGFPEINPNQEQKDQVQRPLSVTFSVLIGFNLFFSSEKHKSK